MGDGWVSSVIFAMGLFAFWWWLRHTNRTKSITSSNSFRYGFAVFVGLSFGVITAGFLAIFIVNAAPEYKSFIPAVGLLGTGLGIAFALLYVRRNPSAFTLGLSASEVKQVIDLGNRVQEAREHPDPVIDPLLIGIVMVVVCGGLLLLDYFHGLDDIPERIFIQIVAVWGFLYGLWNLGTSLVQWIRQKRNWS